MNKLTLSILLLFVVSCNEVHEPGSIKHSEPIIYQVNPYEYIGQDHNLVVESMLSSVAIDTPNYYDPFTEEFNYIEEVSGYVYEAFHDSGVDTEISLSEVETIISAEDFLLGDSTNGFFDDMFYDRMMDEFDSEFLSSLSTKDSIWTQKIFELIYEFSYDNLNSPDVNFPSVSISNFQSQITALETQMLSVNWDSSDSVALQSISILKYSIDLWQDEILPITDSKLDDNHIQGAKEDFIANLKAYAHVKFVGIADLSGMALAGPAAAMAFSCRANLTWAGMEALGIIDAWANSIADSIYP